MIDFIGKKNIFFVISLAFVCFSAFLLITKGLNYGIDFKGGSILHYKFDRNVSSEELRKIFATDEELAKFKINPVIQEVTGVKNEIIMTTPYLVDERTTKDEISKDFLQQRLELALKAKVVDVMRSEDVGSSVSSMLKQKAIKAVVIALICILLYIWVRFDFKFGVTSVIALLHDCTVTLGIFAILGREIDLTFLAAILTIIGYSLNDTIVISDRIRENRLKMRKKELHELINESINQTLGRTINTSLTTFFPVLILFLYGSETLKNFSLAMMIGVVVGTYSSIYVVSALVYVWDKWENKKILEFNAR